MKVAPVPFTRLLVVPKDKKQSWRRICYKYPGNIKLRNENQILLRYTPSPQK